MRVYIKRFNKESLKVPDLQDAVAFAALMLDFLPGRLQWSLVKNEVKDLLRSNESRSEVHRGIKHMSFIE